MARPKHQSNDACYAVSANIIFPVNYHGWKNLLWQRAEIFLCMLSGLFESVMEIEFQAAAYSSSGLTKTKYKICGLSKMEKENVIV